MSARPQPNILYIHSHDTGRYTAAYGHALATPATARLAEAGVVFRQAFSAAPTCSPSRAALLTGQAPHSAGMLGLAHRGFALHDPQQHLAHTLRAAGYTTALAGVQHEADDPRMLGYQHVVSPVAPAALLAERAAAFLATAPQPFFLSVGFVETHRPYPDAGPPPHALRVPAPLPDTPETRRDMAGYAAMVQQLDVGIGAVLAALDASGARDHTLVVLTTDHGLAMPLMKCTLTDHGIGVSLIMHGPGGFAGGQICDALVSHIDIAPTVCELLGLARPAWYHGRSLLPLVDGRAHEVNDAIFAEVTYHAAYEPQRAVRTRRYKYIRRFEPISPVLPNVDDSPSKDILLHSGWRERPAAAEQLYDLLFDPNEMQNLIDDPRFAGVATALRARLADWMAATGDPLLAGPVPLPPTATTNDPLDSSPDGRLLRASDLV
jgi:arylsulfatase A-like enzyme